MKCFVTTLCQVLIFSLLLISCKKNDDAFNDSIVGSWKWTSSIGGIGGFKITPITSGTNIELKITPDNNYIYTTNAVISSEGFFTSSLVNCIHDHTDKKVIDFSSPNDNSLMVEKVDKNNLVLSDDAYDGYIHNYSRN